MVEYGGQPMRKPASIAAYLAILGIVVLEIWYMAFRLYVHFGMIPLWMYRTAVVIAVLFVAAMFRVVFKFQNPLVRVLGIFAGYMAVFLPFLTFAMGIAHLVVLIGNVSLFCSGIGAVLTAFGAVVVGAVLGNTFIVRQREINIPKLQKELTIMQISDAHIGVLYGKRYLSKIIEKINCHNPDIVVITGDLVETKAALKQGVLSPLSRLNAPTFFVAGNHESYPGLAGVLDIIGQQNIRVLQNELVETHGIQLIGLDYLKADDEAYDMHAPESSHTVKSVLAEMEIKAELPAVLLSHNPTGVEYAAAAGVDLMLSGHTHKGQVFPFTIITKLAFAYHGGLYDKGDIKVFVSSGVGGVVARMRLGSCNEVNLLRLVCG